HAAVDSGAEDLVEGLGKAGVTTRRARQARDCTVDRKVEVVSAEQEFQRLSRCRGKAAVCRRILRMRRSSDQRCPVGIGLSVGAAVSVAGAYCRDRAPEVVSVL